MRSTEYIDMPVEQRTATYEAVIARMLKFGIMSEQTAIEALNRVRGQ